MDPPVFLDFEPDISQYEERKTPLKHKNSFAKKVLEILHGYVHSVEWTFKEDVVSKF